MAAAAAPSGSLSLKDRGILAAAGTASAALSLAGSAFIVLCYILFKELRKFSFKLVFFLAVSDMFCSFFSIMGDPSNGLFCYAQNYSTHFFCIASFLWTTTIAFTLHRTVVKHKTDVEDLGSIFHLYVWGTSFAMTVIRSIGSDYGQFGAWCWTGSVKNGKVAHFITFYTPLWGTILYNGFTYYQVNRMLNNATRMAVGMLDRPYQLDSGAGRKALNKWGYYPLILIGSWSFATVNRIFDFLYPEHKIFWLSLADVWFAGLMAVRIESRFAKHLRHEFPVHHLLPPCCPASPISAARPPAASAQAAKPLHPSTQPPSLPSYPMLTRQPPWTLCSPTRPPTAPALAANSTALLHPLLHHQTSLQSMFNQPAPCTSLSTPAIPLFSYTCCS